MSATAADVGLASSLSASRGGDRVYDAATWVQVVISYSVLHIQACLYPRSAAHTPVAGLAVRAELPDARARPPSPQPRASIQEAAASESCSGSSASSCLGAEKQACTPQRNCRHGL